MAVSTLAYEIDTRDVAKAERSIDRLTDSERRALDKTQKLQSALVRMASRAGIALGSLVSARHVLRLADQWEQLQNRVGVATRDMEGAGKMMDRMGEIAKRSFAPVDQTVAAFERAAVTFRDMGRSADEAAKFTESLNLMLVAGYVEGERAASVQNALARAMAVGRMNAMTMETVLANSAEVSQALADELGVTVSQLRSMASQGRVTGDVIANALTSRLEEMRDVVAAMPWTIGGALTSLSTSFQLIVKDVNKAVEATSRIAQAIVFLSDHLGRVVSYVTAAAVVFAGRFAIAVGKTAYGAVAMFIAETVRLNIALGATSTTTALLAGAFKTLGVAIRGALVATGFGALIVIVGELINWFAELVKRVGGIGNAFKLLYEVGVEVFSGIGKQIKASVLPFVQFDNDIRVLYNKLWRYLYEGWSSFLGWLGRQLSGVPGSESISSSLLSGVISAETEIVKLNGRIRDTESATTDLLERAKQLKEEGLDQVTGAFKKLSEAVEEHSEKTEKAPPLLPPILGDEGVGGGAGPKKEKGEPTDNFAMRLERLVDMLRTQRELVDKWYFESQEILNDRRAQELIDAESHFELMLRLQEEYERRKANISGYYSDSALQQAGQFMGDMAENMQSGNEEMLKIARIFSAAQAMINSYLAFTEVLKDKSLPWFARIPAAMGILSAGLGMVKAIQGVSASGSSRSSSGGGGSTASANKSAVSAGPQRVVNLTVQGEYFTGDVIERIADGLNDYLRDGGSLNVRRA